MYKNVIKPLLDYIIAFIALVLLSPIIIIATILLLFANQGKPFFFQVRPGKNEKLFKIIKFKTMNDKKDAEGNLLPDTFRLTTIGKLVRKTSIDELPQLFNIIKGDMSLIGPRPLLPQYLPYYTKNEQKRHTVKPGITGYAQVNGRNNLDWDTKLNFDAEYVDNLSFKLDLSIFFKTVFKVISSKDVAVDNTNVETMLNIIRKDNKVS
ncbi:sugar transferase [Algibacter amylolyticus]|uniref:Sugar transferase n=1 Tax=Algibacter amylolyticus TaxID=1608400 RepID=A0A5M7BED9_9FLAO|nr:sugar transferase [Algibacter amylolyticus]KAA5825605.1 sugar transferase [Algibacter amylolyticus]MBB5268169.1 lipopolysaccharide/colanic/teichoic acid biosynthesis glycosyltransferase [Algibacter amylolyticus]TSJ79903.1 sugar transferase [Algibacter amylolyticus]